MLAKDAERAQARDLRLEGLTYDEIATRLGVSKGSISLWTRDLPRPTITQGKRDARKAGAKRYYDLRRSRVFVERQNEKLAWSNEIGVLSDREVLIAGAVAYWAEGRKAKPWRTYEVVAFVNSDAAMIGLFLRFLTLLDVGPGRLRFQLHIHRSADVVAADQYWSEILGVPSDVFQPTVLKQHAVKTNRKNTGTDYHGCLSVRVLQSAPLYRHIEGIWWAVKTSLPSSLLGPSRVV